MVVVMLVLFVVIILAVALGYRSSGYRTGDLEACQRECAGLEAKGRLIPLLTIRPNKPGAYNGPWKCECWR